MTKLTTTLAVAALLGLVAALAGCGGDDEGDSTAAGPTKAVFIKEADAICTRGNEETEEEFEDKFGASEAEPSAAEQIEAVEDIVLPNIARQGEEIDALTPPEGDDEAIDEIVEALDEDIAAAEANPESLLRSENAAPFEKSSELAAAYGLKACGES